MNCYFVSDLHGRENRYRALAQKIRKEQPQLVLMGGDLLPALHSSQFIGDFLHPLLNELRGELKSAYPPIWYIPGNDDAASEIKYLTTVESDQLLENIHLQKRQLNGYDFYGYAFVPPTPFQLKDWEKYDVSRFVDPGCLSPEEGVRTIDAEPAKVRRETIARDLKAMTNNVSQEKAVWLFHAPPYKTNLDRAALDGKMVDYVPLDVHVGSIAIRRFIENTQPRCTLHGHIHESANITGSWTDQLGSTLCLSAAHRGDELAVVQFDPDCPQKAQRNLINE